MKKEIIEMITHPKMAYYRETYKDSELWDGKKEIIGKKVIVYCQMGFGDNIMFLRFIRFIKERGAMPILHAPKPLLPLIRHMGYECFDKEDDKLPDHDFHLLSLSLPIILECAIPLEPYIKVDESYNEYVDKGKIKIGIAWEGNSQHESNRFRSCPFKHFKSLFREDTEIWMAAPLSEDPTGEYPFLEGIDEVELSSINFPDFYETAKLYNSMDLIVSVDTAAVHLAGAMGKPTYCLLGNIFVDPRWTGLWYPTVKLLKGKWEEIMNKVKIK